MFKDTTLDLTYAKKLVNTSIEGEYLEKVKGFNYKKICIISGANASGKTALSKMMCNINNYLIGRDLNQSNINISDKICNKKLPAKIYVEFVTPENLIFHQLEVLFDDKGILTEKYNKINLLKSDSYNKVKKRLLQKNKKETAFTYDRNDKTNNYDLVEPGFKSVAFIKGKLKIFPGWFYLFADYNNRNKINIETKKSISLMKTILQTFDNSIVNVKQIKESKDNAVLVKFHNKEEIFIIDGEVQRPNRFSRGTIEALELVEFLHRVLNSSDSSSETFFLDEKLAYSHSEIEQMIITLIISKLGRHSQFFYTTHNYDILDLNLPSHSYAFVKKEKYTQIINPEKLGHNKNDRHLLNYVKNDVFGTLPDTEQLIRLM